MTHVELTPEQQKLLPSVQAYYQEQLESGKWPTIHDLAEHFHTKAYVVAQIRQYLITTKWLRPTWRRGRN